MVFVNIIDELAFSLRQKALQLLFAILQDNTDVLKIVEDACEIDAGAKTIGFGNVIERHHHLFRRCADAETKGAVLEVGASGGGILKKESSPTFCFVVVLQTPLRLVDSFLIQASTQRFSRGLSISSDT